MTGKLSHFDAAGQAHMVDVSDKSVTDRIAVAQGYITMRPATLALVMDGTAAKGDVLGIARLAGIMGAKKTADLIPLCHPLPISKVTVDLTPDPASARRADHRDGQNHRPDGRRNGGPDRRVHRRADRARHGQSRAKRHGDRRYQASR